MTKGPTIIDIAIIGAGVIGCAVAWKLSQLYKNRSIFVFERNPGVTEGENQSTRNSGVIHSGIYYDTETRPNKVQFCVEGNKQLYLFCSKYRVPTAKTGKLIVATTEDEESVLEVYLKRAKDNGVKGVMILTRKQINAREPNIRARAGLLVPSAGIVDPASLIYRLYTLAANEGVHFLNCTTVVNLVASSGCVDLAVKYRDGRMEDVRSRMVINCAGVEADRICRMLNPTLKYELDPVRGESYKFYTHKRPELHLSGMNIYPTPESVDTPFGTHFTVGVHLTPTFEDLDYPGRIGTTFTVGPKLVPVQDRDQWIETPLPPSVFYHKVRRYFPGIKEQDLSFHQMGLQARLKGEEDFILLRDLKSGPAIHLLGIDSPGLTSCLSIAQAVVRSVGESGIL